MMFEGNISDFDEIDLEKPLALAQEPSCEYYYSAYADAIQSAREIGSEKEIRVYRFLASLCSFHDNYHDQGEPYKPMWVMEGKRSPIPDDLSEEDVLAEREIARRVSDPTLLARLHDLLWLRERKPEDCKKAAEAYCASAERLDTQTAWTFAITAYARGLQLALLQGKKNDAYLRLASSLEFAINRGKGDEDGFRTSQLLHLAASFRIGEATTLAEISATIAVRAEAKKEYRRARAYWELEEQYRRLSGQMERARNAAIKAAETYVAEAEARVGGDNGSFLAASSFLKSGIEALRQAKGDFERIEMLRRRLQQYQEKSLQEMKTFSTEVDLQDMVEQAEKHVAGLELADALRNLAFGPDLVKVSKLRKQVLKNVKDFPLQHVFGGSIVDEKGRSRKERPGLLLLEGAEAQRALEAEMFANLAQFHWTIRASGFIEPARRQILREHYPRLQDLTFLVRDNPFVPPDHEGIFLRGIHAGLHGDFLLTAHLLVPQIEHSIRNVLEINGIDVSNLRSDGTQPLKVLGPLLGMEDTKDVFGESVVFELRGLLIEKSGYAYRDRVAHGFVSESDCYGEAVVNIWWLVLRLCLIPILQRAKLEAESTNPSSQKG